MGRRLTKLNQFFFKDWRIMAYQPVLYLFIFGASIRLWHNETEPPNFKEAIADHSYGLWLVLGVFGPIISLISWFMIKIPSGRSTFVGMWVRLAADIGVFTNILSYHLVTLDGKTEEMIFSRYILGSTLLFVFLLIVRDLWTIYVMEKLAGQINSEIKSR